MTLQERLRQWADEGGPRTRCELEHEAANRIDELENSLLAIEEMADLDGMPEIRQAARAALAKAGGE